MSAYRGPMRRLRLLVPALLCAGCGSAHHASPSPTPTPGRRVDPPPRHRPPLRLQARVAAHLPAPVQLPAVTPVRGGVLAAGGLDAADASTANVVRITGRRGRVVAHLPRPLHDAAAATVAGAPYLFGGGDAGAGTTAILRLGPAVKPAGQLPAGASDVSAATLGDTAYVVGGYTGTTPLRTIVAFRPGPKPRVAGHLPRPLRYAAVAAVDGAVLIAGGTSGTTARREVLRFDPRSGRVTRVARLPVPLTHAAAAALNGHFYVLGGRGDGLTSQRASIYALDHGRMVDAGRLPAALSDLGAAASGGRILALGGRDATGHVHDAVLALRPATAAATRNVYAAGRPGNLAAAARGVPARVYVPETEANRVDVIDQRTARIIRTIPVGRLPQHVTPSWDLKTLWVSNDEGNSLTPIDPHTSRPGTPVPVADPYNLYFTADGRRAIVVAEAQKALDFRSPHTMKLRHRLNVPQCAGVDHMDYTASGHFALVSCEFAGRMIVVDLRRERVVRTIALRKGAMPQDVKLSPDGRTFYVADMASNGVWLIGARHFTKQRFQRTGAGAHGLYPDRASRRLFVSNRGEGTISVLSFRTRRPIRKWRLPAGSSPDMGGVSASGRVLWLSGRYDSEVYAISTRSGRLLHRIKVGAGPHGMCVWPQPGRYSIGHTGILR